MSLNKVMLIGHLGGDPKTKQLESGDLTTATLATSENYKGSDGEWKQKTEWHNISAWNKLSDRITSLGLKKGDLVYVEGKISSRQYTDKDGVEKRFYEISASSISRLGKNGKEE